jgi:hypothetical protein
VAYGSWCPLYSNTVERRKKVVIHTYMFPIFFTFEHFPSLLVVLIFMETAPVLRGQISMIFTSWKGGELN